MHVPRPRRWSRAALLVLGLGSLLPAAPPAALAQSSSAECRSNPHLSRAKDEYDRLEFDRAARTLQRAIEYSKNCRWDLAEVYRLKAFVDAVNGERERCQRAFEILLALEPAYEMAADVPPKIRTCFEDARRVPGERRELRLVHSGPKVVQPSAPVSLPVRVVDPLRLVDQVQVFFRREGVKIYTVVMARADENLALVIPALHVPPDEKGYALEYFVRAVDRWEGTLVEQGTARDPLRLDVAPASSGGPLLTRWWFWTVLGAVAVVGAGLAIAAGQGSGDAVTLTFRDGGVAGGG
jgi:hypothetical protein